MTTGAKSSQVKRAQLLGSKRAARPLDHIVVDLEVAQSHTDETVELSRRQFDSLAQAADLSTEKNNYRLDLGPPESEL
jgi:hypothetical protein